MKMVWIMLLVALLGANTLAYTDYSMLRVLSARNFVDFTSRSNGINLNGAKSTKFCYNYYKSMKLESNKKTEHYCPVRDSKSVLKHPTTSAQLLLRPNLNEGINSVLKASKVKEALSCWESIGLDGFPKFLSVVLEQGVDFRQMNAMHLAGRLESLLLVFDWSDTNAIAKLTKTMQLLKMSRDVVSSEFALSLSIKFQQWLSNDAPMLLPEKIMPILKRLTQLGYNRANILDSTSKSSLLTLLQNCSSFEEQCHAYDIILRSRFKVHEIPQCYFNRHFVDKLLAEDVWCNSSATQKRAQYLRILLFPKLLERVSLGRKTLIRSIDALLVKLQSIDRQELDIISLMLVLNQVHLSIQDISIANRNFIFVAINEALEDYRIQMDWPRYDKLVLLSLRAISVDTNISECSFLLTATRSLLSRTLEINNRSYINFLCLPPSFHLLLSNQGARITSDAIDMLINIFMGKILENFDHNVKRLAPFLRLSTQIPANNPHDFRQILDHYNQKSARDLNALLENYIERKSLSSQFSVLAELPDINTNAHRLKDIYKHLFEAVKLKNVEEDKIKFLNYIKIALDAMLGISRSRKPSLCAQPWGSIAQLLVQLGPCNALDQFIGSSLLCGVDINTESDMFPERSKIRALASTAKLQEFNPHLYHVQFPISRYFDAWDAIIDQLSKSEMLYILYYSSFMGISHFNILSSFQSKSLLILCDVKNPPLTSKQLALLLWTMIKMKVPINELPDRVRSCLVENIVDSATRVSKTFN